MNINLAVKYQTIVIGLIVFMFIVTASISLKASETETNWDWMNLKLTVQKTNFFVGDKVMVNVIASNVLENAHLLHWYAGDPCNSGIGNFLITDLSSGNQIQCKLSRDEKATLYSSYRTFLEGHKSKIFEADLTKGYSITNVGSYGVQVQGWFPLNEQPTNNQYITIVTAPIIIQLSPKSETNAPSKF